MYLRYGDPSWDSPESLETPAVTARAVDGTVSAGERQPEHPPRRTNRSVATERLPVVEVHGVEFHAITEAQCIEHVLSELDAGRGGVVVTPNLDYVRRCNKDVQFAAMVAESDLIVPDGMPLIWASRIQGTPLPERVAGSNLISSLSGAAAKRGRRVFLLGGAPGAAEGAARVLRERFPEIQIAGIHVPPFGYEKNPKQLKEMEEAVVASRPDIVWLALGAPKQERTMVRLAPLVPQAWLFGVGNSFSFLSGDVRRAPRWMQRTGLEWAHRLCQEPGKLWKRYLVAGVPFAASLLGHAVARGVSNRLRRRRRDRRPRGAADSVEFVIPVAVPAPSANGNGHAHATAPANRANEAGGNSVALPTNGHPAAEAPPAAAVFSPADSGLAMEPPKPNGRMNGGAPAVDELLARLRALVLLGGSVRPSPLTAAAGRSILDLPLDESGSLLNFWLSQGVEVTRLASLARLPVRVLVNGASHEPTTAHEKYYGTFRVERDLSEYRGTGGVLRDVAADYADDDLILVATAAQILLDPLSPIAAALARQGGDVNLVSHEDGTPSGVMLVRCGALRQIAVTGFVDMKEQALPQIASRFDVRVLRRRRPTGLPVRTLEDYVQALRFHHRRRSGKPFVADPMAEDFSPAFSLVEAGAQVDPAARVHDSVVLAGGSVGPGAVLVRCLVCPGAVVKKDRTAVDEFVLAAPSDHRRRALPAIAATL